MIDINVTKQFRTSEGGTFTALSDVRFQVGKGEFVTIFGPNGSGKTTLLNILAGLDNEFKGSVTINHQSPKQANIGFVFQNYNDALFPWKNVLENVTLPLIVKGVDKTTAETKALKLLKRVGLDQKAKERIYTLSGGQRQLVSICRSFVRDPDFLILDEPCSALDYQTTKRVELEIQDLWLHSNIPALCVSHDIDEAVFLADRVVVLSRSPGKIKAIVAVPLPRPRTLDVFTSQEFFRIRNEVLAQFSYE